MTIQTRISPSAARCARKSGPGLKRFVFTSGKGGVGKTNLACNTAIAMGRLGRRVALFDADLGLANIDVLLGMKPRYTLRQVIHGRKTVREIMMDGPEGIGIIPGGSGVRELADLTPDERGRCIASFSELGEGYDVLIVDTSGGITRNVLSFLLGVDEIVLVTTPEPTALTDAYALIKVVCMEEPDPRIRLVVNMASDEEDALSTARRIQVVAASFLNLDVDYAGHIPVDEEVAVSVRVQEPVLLRSEGSPAAKAISLLARRLSNGYESGRRLDRPGFGVGRRAG